MEETCQDLSPIPGGSGGFAPLLPALPAETQEPSEALL